MASRNVFFASFHFFDQTAPPPKKKPFLFIIIFQANWINQIYYNDALGNNNSSKNKFPLKKKKSRFSFSFWLKRTVQGIWIKGSKQEQSFYQWLPMARRRCARASSSDYTLQVFFYSVHYTQKKNEREVKTFLLKDIALFLLHFHQKFVDFFYLFIFPVENNDRNINFTFPSMLNRFTEIFVVQTRIMKS